MKTRDALAPLIVAALVFAPLSAHAEDEVEPSAVDAERLATEAERKALAGEYAKAMELYVTAYQKAPAAVLLFDMAWLYDHHLNSRDEAIDLYQKALAAGDLEPRLAKLADERLAALQHVASNVVPVEKPVTPEKKTAEGWSALKIGGVATAGVGLVGIGTSIVLGALAKSKDDEAGTYCNGDRCTDARALSLTDDATGLATGANIAFITGAVFLVGGVVMWLVAK